MRKLSDKSKSGAFEDNRSDPFKESVDDLCIKETLRSQLIITTLSLHDSTTVLRNDYQKYFNNNC